MEIPECEYRISWIGYFPVTEYLGAVLLSSVTSRWGKGQGSRDSAAVAAVNPHFSGSRRCFCTWGNWADWLRCVSLDDVDNWDLNLSLKVFLYFSLWKLICIYYSLGSFFCINMSNWSILLSNWSTLQVSGVILIIALITWKRLDYFKSFFCKLKSNYY